MLIPRCLALSLSLQTSVYIYRSLRRSSGMMHLTPPGFCLRRVTTFRGPGWGRRETGSNNSRGGRGEQQCLPLKVLSPTTLVFISFVGFYICVFQGILLGRYKRLHQRLPASCYFKLKVLCLFFMEAHFTYRNFLSSQAFCSWSCTWEAAARSEAQG